MKYWLSISRNSEVYGLKNIHREGQFNVEKMEVKEDYESSEKWTNMQEAVNVMNKPIWSHKTETIFLWLNIFMVTD